MDGFFKDTPLSGLEPSSVYDLNTAVIARAPDAMQKAWGETYTYTVIGEDRLLAGREPLGHDAALLHPQGRGGLVHPR